MISLPIEIENQFYVKKVLCNNSLEDIENEHWELIDGFENYAISDYGRVKSLERKIITNNGGQKILPEIIMKLFFIKRFNKYLNHHFYGIQCSLCLNGQKYRKSITRLVYYHFVEKFDMEDRNIIISFKDNDSLNLHFSNLEIVSAKDRRLKTYASNRARNRKIDYLKPISQYTVQGDLVATFDTIYDAEKTISVGCESIQNVITKEFLTAGGFRWFLQSNPPKKEDFIVAQKLESTSDSFNKSLWEKLGKPAIDFSNPPPCMNLSLINIPGEEWKPIPSFENSFHVSNKGRVKHLSGWTSGKKKFFMQEKILHQTIYIKIDKSYSFHVALYHNGKIKRISTHHLVYNCFVEEFDLFDKKNAKAIINKNKPSWNMDISKLSLKSTHSILKKV